MQSTPSHSYSQSVDKQRIVIVGKNKSKIAQLVLFVLEQCHHKFDCSTTTREKFTTAPIIIIESDLPTVSLLEYNHHILVISALATSEKSDLGMLASATPKCGMIIFDESDSVAKGISKMERTDVFTVPYSVVKPSATEKVPASLSSPEDLKNAGAVFELVKKIGISSEQFYKAILSFQ